ncbi:glycosyl hydrolase [Agarivorans sp. Alg241-V36]|uniref:glycosyl hydrolase n=1 Tax=Agarivorans sp. Alg241-V36 TaxID=2305992 RepID=UPI0013D7E14E|nr:glycosyl hydrolase [Agarivorans sp. Alg241-V36]
MRITLTPTLRRKLNSYLILTQAGGLALLLALPVKALETLDYLYSIQGKHTLGAMHNRQPNSNPNLYSSQLQQVTGKWPSLYSTDFQFEPQEVTYRQTITNQVITEWNNGAMIHLMWHACNPAKQSPCEWDEQGVLSQMSDQEWNNLITDGSNLNLRWKAMMDEIAVYLQQMKDAGVEVLFRPLHEMNQSLFWWGGRPGAEGSARLYQITHDYLLYEKGLTNIVWLWNLQDFQSLAQDLNDYDPGNDYWDVLTLDMYWSDGQGYTTQKYQAMSQKAAGKPMAISECDDIPMPTLLAQQPLWTFFMPWSELTFAHNSSTKLNTVYQSDRVLTLEEMPGWLGYQFPNSPQINKTYIQAQHYSNQSGIVLASSSDNGGAQMATSIDAYDWLSFNNISVKKSGNYVFAFRVASSNGASLRLEHAGGGESLATVVIPPTGSMSNWTTAYATVYLSAGTHSLGIKALTSGWNMNWFSYDDQD